MFDVDICLIAIKMKKIIQSKKYLLFLIIASIVMTVGVYKANTLKYYFSLAAVRLLSSDEKPKVFIEGVLFISQVGHEDEELSRLGCEEAALVMVESYLSGKKPAKVEQEEEMRNLIKYQKEHYGGHNQLGAEKLRKLSKDVYGIDGIVLKENFPEEINKSLDKENPVIVPALAKYLKNPLYSEKGYHMLVIVGYNGSGYFTHDPGASGGAFFFYPKENLFDSIYDVNTKDKEILILGD